MQPPLIVWVRRDFRLSDNRMLTAASASGRPVLPVFVLDPETEAIGAAAKWRLGLAIDSFAETLQGLGSRLILRRGPALETLLALVRETGAGGVMWQRLYDPASMRRDAAAKVGLREAKVQAESFAGALLTEPWQIRTGAGTPFQVYTPFWRAVSAEPIPPPVPAVTALPSPALWPQSDRLEDWALGAAMNRAAAVLLPYQRVGEAQALTRLQDFLTEDVAAYDTARDQLGLETATSGLSENLALGEISPRQIWEAAEHPALRSQAGAITFRKELVWREFAAHLAFHNPGLGHENWRAGWQDFPWRGENSDAEAWRRGMTGEPVIDAAMRELYATGHMHNRARMLVASYLTKHLLTDWRIGLAWFADCLTDWDAASNAMGWQWVAGTGPDAAPYFRIFNPATQADRFDASGAYRRRWLDPASPEAAAFFRATPRRWRLNPSSPRPEPLIALDAGRQRALAAFQQRKS